MSENSKAVRTFHFDTGVRPERIGYKLSPGHVLRGTVQIPFDCEGVPERATFEFACDHTPPGSEHLLRVEMKNTVMVSRYAFFRVPEDLPAC